MATIIITNANAGNIIVSDGECYVIDSSLTDNVTFINPGGTNVSFEVQFNASNPNNLRVDFDDPGLNPTITIADSVDLSDIQIDARDADTATVDIGDDVTLERYRGSSNGDDTFTAGDNFALANTLNLGNGTNTLTIGDDFNAAIGAVDILSGSGEDTVSIGADANIDDIRLRGGRRSADPRGRIDIRQHPHQWGQRRRHPGGWRDRQQRSAGWRR